MAERKRHLRVDRFGTEENFTARGRPRTLPVARQDRVAHGNTLLNQYTVALERATVLQQEAGEPITDETGIYLRLEGAANTSLPLDSLDNRDFRLQSLHREGENEIAVVFVPDARKQALRRKLVAYLDESRDRNNKPANQRLVDSIASIRIADLQSFWTDNPALFPQDPHQPIWWEVWLSGRNQTDYLDLARAFANRVGAEVGNAALTFYGAAVVLLRCTVEQLERGIELISCLSELRKAKETPNVFVGMRPVEQRAWANDIAQRVAVLEDTQVAACILDTGVNFNHPILLNACADDRAVSWNDEWPKYHEQLGRRNLEHGSLQAGIVMLGDVRDVATSHLQIELPYTLESGRILPPFGQNHPDLYGAITIDTARKVENIAPERRRVFSLAVTAPHDGISGQPTSWSSAIDNFSCFHPNHPSRLFVISTGNNRDLNPQFDYWEKAQLAVIEDPAQSWNALTVGAFTELTTNDDPDYDGWSPWAQFGDLSPASLTSVNWGWRQQAPYKPDVVAEGGNRLLSPDQTEVTDADTVSLLTTSGRTAGPDFDTTRDTSAATALVTRDAAILAAEYPELWPETLRGLIAHSAEWTDRMFARKGLLERQHSPKIANEIMLRTFGYGFPNLDRARYSANNQLTLVAQSVIQPFIKHEDSASADDAKLNHMHLYELPWPADLLRDLGPMEIRMRVTLSYFIEPNPGRRGHRQRFNYQSHGLRFEVIRPGQELANFRAFVNGAANREDYEGPQGNSDGWRFGPQLRSRGSLHSDTWNGSAADLADMNVIAVYPVSGWWKSRASEGRWNAQAPYSLIVTIETPDEDIDIYATVENLINIAVEVQP